MRRVLVLGITALALTSSVVAASKKPAARKHTSGASQPAGMMDAMNGVQTERIRDDIKYLASDALEGRGTGTHGGDLAAAYIAKQLKDAGVEAAGDNGTYFQRVPMIGTTTLPNTTIAVKTPKRTLNLRLLDEVVAFTLDQNEFSDVSAGVVFAGYGITAPEFGWDDYAGADVKGKILLMLVNEPPSDDPKFFGGKALTCNGSGRAWKPLVCAALMSASRSSPASASMVRAVSNCTQAASGSFGSRSSARLERSPDHELRTTCQP